MKEIEPGFVRYRRVIPREQYGSEEIEVCVPIGVDEHPFRAMRAAKIDVHRALNATCEELLAEETAEATAQVASPTPPIPDAVVDTPHVELRTEATDPGPVAASAQVDEPEKPKKKRGRRTKAEIEAAKAEVEKAEPAAPTPEKIEEAKADEAIADLTNDTQVGEDEDEDHYDDIFVEDEAPAPKPKKVKTPNTKYDRENAQHKALLVKVFGEVDKNWKDLGKPKIANMSKDLANEDFLDGDGNVLESFRDTVQAFITHARST